MGSIGTAPISFANKRMERCERKLEVFRSPYAKELGITIKHPEEAFLPYTHLALQGYIYAKEQGRAQDYVKRVFSALFEEDGISALNTS